MRVGVMEDPTNPVGDLRALDNGHEDGATEQRPAGDQGDPNGNGDGGVAAAANATSIQRAILQTMNDAVVKVKKILARAPAGEKPPEVLAFIFPEKMKARRCMFPRKQRRGGAGADESSRTDNHHKRRYIECEHSSVALRLPSYDQAVDDGGEGVLGGN